MRGTTRTIMVSAFAALIAWNVASLAPAQSGQHVHTSNCKRWAPPTTRTVKDRVWIKGAARRIWVPAKYKTTYGPGGNPVQTLVRRGYYKTVRDKGRWEVRSRRVTVPGRWKFICGH
ncbi:MAG: hypothetical protein CMJ83_01795 [Planctomycetes bacterium]|nr:hypothetical protein [Planctomycetota bacterium]